MLKKKNVHLSGLEIYESPAEDIILLELNKRKRTIEHIEKKLAFIKKWLAEEPEGMEGYLKGRQSGLKEVLIILK